MATSIQGPQTADQALPSVEPTSTRAGAVRDAEAPIPGDQHVALGSNPEPSRASRALIANPAAATPMPPAPHSSERIARVSLPPRTNPAAWFRLIETIRNSRLFNDRGFQRQLLRDTVKLDNTTEPPMIWRDLEVGGRQFGDAADMVRAYNPQFEQIAEMYNLNDPLRETRMPASFSGDGQDFTIELNAIGFAIWKEAGLVQERRGLDLPLARRVSINGYGMRELSQDLKEAIIDGSAQFDNGLGEDQRFSLGIGSVKAERVNQALVVAIEDDALRNELWAALQSPEGQALGHVPSAELVEILREGDPLASAHIIAATFAMHQENIEGEQRRITENPSAGRYPGYANLSVIEIPHSGVWGTSRLTR